MAARSGPALLVAAVVAMCASTASADPPRAEPSTAEPAGQSALTRARASWEKGDYDVAEPLYAEAIAQGGLDPTSVLEAYVQLGSVRAVLGKKAAALASFKAAALLDSGFNVPSEAGKRAIILADQAKRAMARAGQPRLVATVPDSIDPGDRASVDVTLDPAHAAVAGSRISLLAREPGSGRSHTDAVRAAPSVHFDLPAQLALPSTTMQVRVDWVDAHANRLATAEQRIHVQPLSDASTSVPAAPLAVAPIPKRDEPGSSGGGFWHSPWPYVIAGAALAAGGAAIYFATRSPSSVDVTGVRVLTQ